MPISFIYKPDCNGQIVGFIEGWKSDRIGRVIVGKTEFIVNKDGQIIKSRYVGGGYNEYY